MVGRAAWAVIVVALAITMAHATPAQDAELAKLTKAAVAYEDARQYAEAEPLELKIIASITKDEGAQAKQLIEPLDRLAGIYSALQRTDEAEAIWIRIVAVAKQAYGDQSAEHARYLMQYARMLDARSEYSSAQRVYEQALTTYDALPKGTSDGSMIGVLQALGQLYLRTNQYAKSQPVFDRAIELTLAGKDTKPLFNLNVLWATGTIYWNAGRKDLATPLFTRAIAMAKKEIAALEKTSPTSADLVFMHSTLGFMHWYQGDLAKAGAVYDQALQIVKKGKLVLGIEGTVAALRRAQGRNKEALALLETANSSMKMTTASFYDLMSAEALAEMGEHERATALVTKYLREVAKAYGKQATYTYGLSRAVDIHAVAGDIKNAEPLLAEWLTLAEKEITLVLRTGTDADHAAYSAQNTNVLDAAISFNLTFGPRRPTATRLAVTTLLRRKGRILDASAGAMATIRKKLSPDDRKLLDALTAARTQLAKLSIAGPSGGDATRHAKDIAALEQTVQKLEGQISRKSAAYRSAIQSVELAAIQKRIPTDTRLVEIANYEPRDPRRTNAQITAQPHLARRYVAYIVAATGDPILVDLGDAAAIELAIAKFRKSLADPDDDQAATLGNQLHALTTAKILPKLGGATNVLIAPDGALNVVPFSALVDDKKDFLIKKYTFTYLTSGRDLLRLAVKTKGQGGGVLFADPLFDDAGPAPGGGTSRGRRSAALSSLSWPQLPGTAAEADAIGKTYKGLTILRGAKATEGALKRVKGPKILHLATHGFFLPDDEPDPTTAPPAGGIAAPAPPAENPLLRSGLALAGANKLKSGDDDGLLTALEASGLDLEGTKLVVLSACETGIGKVTNGDGVYGLRRSLVIAGAESLVMSMWQVDDFATKDLMAGFYKKLASGAPRTAALRETQLELLSNPKYAHPFYWAAFLPAGATTPLKD